MVVSQNDDTCDRSDYIRLPSELRYSKYRLKLDNIHIFVYSCHHIHTRIRFIFKCEQQQKLLHMNDNQIVDDNDVQFIRAVKQQI